MKCPRCDADTVRVMTKSIPGWRCLGSLCLRYLQLFLAFYRRNPCT